MKTTILREAIDLTEARLDTSERLLRGVTLIRAGMSKNRRHYPAEVLERAAPIFEGVKAYDSHVKGARKLAEITGWYRNVRYDAGALKADRYFSRTTAGQNVMAIVEDILAGVAPASLAGLSINAVGAGTAQKFADGDALNVESITAATSVDDVDEPAAGGTYLAASADGDALAADLLAALTFEEWFAARPEFIRRVHNELKQVRLDETTKAATAEADRKVKAADVEARQAQAALREAQERIEVLTTAREAAVAMEAAARRELTLERLLGSAKLPADLKAELRKQLSESDESRWQGILDYTLLTVQKAGGARVAVSGADQQVQRPAAITERRDDAAPIDMTRFNTPEKLAAELARRGQEITS